MKNILILLSILLSFSCKEYKTSKPQLEKNTSIKNEESLIIEEGSIKTINLPFSFYDYFKDEYSDKKYHSYKNESDYL